MPSERTANAWPPESPSSAIPTNPRDSDNGNRGLSNRRRAVAELAVPVLAPGPQQAIRIDSETRRLVACRNDLDAGQPRDDDRQIAL